MSTSSPNNIFDCGDIVEVFTYNLTDFHGRPKSNRGIIGLVEASNDKFLRLKLPDEDSLRSGWVIFTGFSYVFPLSEIEYVMVCEKTKPTVVKEKFVDAWVQKIPKKQLTSDKVDTSC